jgi:hypothetical protein
MACIKAGSSKCVIVAHFRGQATDPGQPWDQTVAIAAANCKNEVSRKNNSACSKSATEAQPNNRNCLRASRRAAWLFADAWPACPARSRAGTTSFTSDRHAGRRSSIAPREDPRQNSPGVLQEALGRPTVKNCLPPLLRPSGPHRRCRRKFPSLPNGAARWPRWEASYPLVAIIVIPVGHGDGMRPVKAGSSTCA